MLQRRADERSKQRMRLQRLRFELRMELAPEIPRMFRQFANLHVDAIRRLAGKPKTVGRQLRLEIPIELVAMAMPLADFSPVVGALRKAARREHARIRAEPHGAAELIHSLQLTKLINDPVCS